MKFTMQKLSRAAGRGLLALALVTALGALSPFETLFAPKAEPWPRWQAHDPAATAVIDHSAWDRFLKTYVARGPGGVNRVAYGRVSESDKRALDGYVKRLQATAIDAFNRNQQRAFWINLYNAATVKLILDHKPEKSILDIDISPGLFANGPWGKKLLNVMGEPLSLNDIEHRILRPIWRDPRLHYALNCASVGCPDLQGTAFTGKNSEALLDAAAQAYVNHRRGTRIDGGRLIVSKIYGWFADDFGGNAEAVIAHLKRYADESLAKALEGRTTIDDYEYDWGLNGET